jgi:D-alanine-D-alanine ligase-like ATP-grasp enzyme
MGECAGRFFFLLIGLELDSGRQPNILRKAGHATIGEALDASAVAFDKAGTKDRFKLVQGDSSLKLIP